MLQQIIRDMYIEPDLLAELSDEQKQLIFMKIREEQVRRWTEQEEKSEKQSKVIKNANNPTKTKHSAKTVQFLLGCDQNPWVWVMGEHLDDKSIDDIIEEEAHNLASQKAEKEAELLRAKEEKEAEERLKQEEKKLEEQRLKQERELAQAAAKRQEAENAQKLAQSKQEAAKAEQELRKLKEKSEKARITREESYRVLKEKRTSEIMSAFQKTKLLWEKKAAEDGKQIDQAWKQQEKKAKQAETSLRRLVKASREDYRRHSMNQSQGSEVQKRTPRMSREVFRESAVLLSNAVTATKPSKLNKSRKPRPNSKKEIEDWFVEEEKQKRVGLSKSGQVEPWFHGIISREEAESLLSPKPVHSFIVRVSEKIWGYAISYKADDRCKHYLIDTTEHGYQFFGTNQLEHPSLLELIQHHKNHPVSTAGQELLMFPVGQGKGLPDYATLFPELVETTSL